ncbi:hypothetical protein AVEN_80036-1 [Araneus ventricosus]|uniref:Thioester reductase (TE) domain-containing protein n=1 Tax=Araneus ventricosus TaxID=182803 RepID=A0A4Y1ZP95_ARAVE|nr:hypothetical protein AVEN_80036-1 [Araneus ventricosus]
MLKNIYRNGDPKHLSAAGLIARSTSMKFVLFVFLGTESGGSRDVSLYHYQERIRFLTTKPYHRFLLKNNVLSLSSVIELCRKMRKFEVLVYTSTAYSNCNHLNFPLKEEVYRLPFHAGQFLDALK